MSVATLVIDALRALSSIAPLVIKQGHGDRIPKVLDTIATLVERGTEGTAELKALVKKLQDMNGVSRSEQYRLWVSIESRSAEIAEAAKLIPPDPPDTLPPVSSPPAEPPPVDQEPPSEPVEPKADQSGNSGGDAGGSGAGSQ